MNEKPRKIESITSAFYFIIFGLLVIVSFNFMDDDFSFETSQGEGSYILETPIIPNTLTLGEKICGQNNTIISKTVNGWNCNAFITAELEDGSIGVHEKDESFTWNEIRSRQDGNYLSIHMERNAVENIFDLTHLDSLKSYLPDENYNVYSFKILRTSLPFDTSYLPESAQITNANLTVKKRKIKNNNPGSHDFITLVGVDLINPPNLSLQDFGNFSFVDDPVELSQRIDLSVNQNQELFNFPLNKQGIRKINKEGYSVFGLRGGYELFGEIPPNLGNEVVVLKFYFWSANSDYPPYLDINFLVPIKGTGIAIEE